MIPVRYTFVLWGRRFDGAVATYFVSALRQAGLRVKVVGLDGESPVGLHGVVLVPDMPLSKAVSYTAQTACIIVPCQACQWPYIQEDPRLVSWLVTSQQAGGVLVIDAEPCLSAGVQSRVVDLLHEPVQAALSAVAHYPCYEDLPGFLGELVEWLGG